MLIEILDIDAVLDYLSPLADDEVAIQVVALGWEDTKIALVSEALLDAVVDLHGDAALTVSVSVVQSDCLLLSELHSVDRFLDKAVGNLLVALPVKGREQSLDVLPFKVLSVVVQQLLCPVSHSLNHEMRLLRPHFEVNPLIEIEVDQHSYLEALRIQDDFCLLAIIF